MVFQWKLRGKGCVIYMSNKRKLIGVVGDSDAVMAFRTIGMRVIAARSAKQASSAVFQLVSDGIPVIFITENIARLIPETLEQYISNPAVSLIPIPGAMGSDGLGMGQIHANIEKAVGADILLNNTEETL